MAKKTREQRRRDNAAYDKAQRALNSHRGNGEDDKYHRLNDASLKAKENATWPKQNGWT